MISPIRIYLPFVERSTDKFNLWVVMPILNFIQTEGLFQITFKYVTQSTAGGPAPFCHAYRHRQKSVRPDSITVRMVALMPDAVLPIIP